MLTPLAAVFLQIRHDAGAMLGCIFVTHGIFLRRFVHDVENLITLDIFVVRATRLISFRGELDSSPRHVQAPSQFALYM